MKKEFVENMLQAKRYEMKAIYSLLPDPLRGKIETSGKELFRMVVRYGMELLQEEGGMMGEKEKKVRKVTID